MQKGKFFTKYNKTLILFFDVILVSGAFLIWAWIKPATINQVLPKYWLPFLFFLSIWVTVSFVMGKYNLHNFTKAPNLLFSIILIDIIIFVIVAIMIFAFNLSNFSRLIVFGTILFSLLFEIITFNFFYKYIYIYNINKRKAIDRNLKGSDSQNLKNTSSSYGQNSLYKNLQNNLIIREAGQDVYDYFAGHININNSNIGLISTTTPFNIENLKIENIRTIINLKKVNDMRYINKFFESVNEKLPDTGMFMGSVETSKQRYNRMSAKFSRFIGKIVIMLDFVINRIIPKLTWMQGLYFNLTRGHGRTLSKAETLGRLVSCGFSIIEFKEINNLTYFVVMKTGEPEYNMNPSYAAIFPMPRIGKNGKIINVYKFRTMHPYSEYLRDYVLSLNGFSPIGKMDGDFRLTKWGKFMRKLWLDELPQLINVMKGEMALFGTRPLSKSAYKDYPDDIKEMRNKYKPGCVPPYVALLMQGMDASIEAERKYLTDLKKNPRTTKIKYLFKALFNIFTNKIRSS